MDEEVSKKGRSKKSSDTGRGRAKGIEIAKGRGRFKESCVKGRGRIGWNGKSKRHMMRKSWS